MNTLIVPGSGQISFSQFLVGSSELPPLSSSARIAYTPGGGLTIVSTASSLDRFSVEGVYGNLLTVNDTATGVLFKLSDISGFPKFSVDDSGNTNTTGTISSQNVVYASGGNSNLWNSTYATVCTFSASWEESGDILPTVINYLSTNNVSISGLTVTQNLSVGGTIFSSATALVIANFETIIGNNTNSSFTINHNLNTDKIQVTVYDVINNIASYPSIQIINSNSISISFGFIPSLNSYRILVYGLVPSNQINAYGQIYTITYATTGLGNIPTLSGNWNSTYETVCALSALWSQGGQNAGTASYTLTAENFIISNSSSWAVDTTANTVYGVLPASPSSGFTIKFLDAKETWAANNLIIINNGNNIESLTEDLSANINGFSLSLTYVGGTIGWRVY